MEAERQESFLNTIAGKLGRHRRHAVTPPNWQQKPYEQLHRENDRKKLIQPFIGNLAALNTEVSHIDRSEMADALDFIIQKFKVTSAISWDDDRLHQLQLGKHFFEKKVEFQVWDPMGDEQELRDLVSKVDMGITFAEMGLSETGTVVLWNGGGRGRLVSALPPVYVAILSESTIFPRLSDSVAAIHDQISNGLPSCINFITGPSRTGDIEMELALGVHGPGKVHVILLKD
ncbi:LutC/YkgG family protein [Neobacillus mesonae]|uniref:Lactate utilization protein C n=1 Tax=Neobacillus mesonae TaxID=1193713 RepID=A0A3Q9QVP4_9BACI|nr:lactate utilization protein C [Neobacillus mesonae]AZU62677.1 lactate utilization protein C [Neobacillus mesonae]